MRWHMLCNRFQGRKVQSKTQRKQNVNACILCPAQHVFQLVCAAARHTIPAFIKTSDCTKKTRQP